MNEEKIKLSHGSGGKLSQDLIKDIMLAAFDNDILAEMHDAARFPVCEGRLAFSTDSYVVKPLFFRGGDIGKLAVCGTVNDLAMAGAKPLYLSTGFIIEEGFLLADLRRIVESMRQAANEAGVKIVTGDTKVVERGAADGIYINTAGIGAIPAGVNIAGNRARPGQNIILSGSLGEHALAIMSERHGLVLPEHVASDCAPLNGLVAAVLAEVPQVVVMRDPTRGGLAAVLNEIAGQSQVGISISEGKIPVSATVAAGCDILGFDPLYLANEGKMILFVEDIYTEKVLAILKAHQYGRDAGVIGHVTAKTAGQVVVETVIGGTRILDMPVGEQLPRIC